jgi:hypothetical protein
MQMPDLIPLTEAGLRSAMRDPRPWTSGHPEREAYAKWVTQGWQDFVRDGPERGGMVQVRAYTRMRNGKPQQVAAHTRGDPPGGDGGTDAAIQPIVYRRETRPGDDLPTGPSMERIPGQSGKENASGIPSWARGQPRMTGENPKAYSERLMDRRYGAGNWEDNDDRLGERQKIQKFGQRAFRIPRRLGGRE